MPFSGPIIRTWRQRSESASRHECPEKKAALSGVMRVGSHHGAEDNFLFFNALAAFFYLLIDK